ncbi:MAG: cupredoxin domain-containing protein [Thermoplasmatota archaeon]
MRALLVIIATSAILMAGCTSTSDPSLPAPPKDAQGRYMITATAQNEYTPKDTQVPIGATVIWKVAPGAIHDVNSKGGPESFSSDAQFPQKMRGNDTFEFTFAKAGTYPYYCKLHGEPMAGSIKVA